MFAEKIIKFLLYLLVFPMYVIFNTISMLLRHILLYQNIHPKDDNADNVPLSPETNIATNIKQETIDRITVKTGQKLHIIPIQDIIYLKSDGDYVQIITKTGTHLKEQTMKYFETFLPQNQFVRIHRSYIVNVEHISCIESYEEVALKNGQWLKMSASGHKLLKEALQL